ncbi:MAG: dihydropyrimidinase [Candidatus Marinimicrobia bacterium]|jgi:dihydropyrimidinase|nr:dihydropyrimidinase [Candidatus Neomarinimicrobiota bacterium]MBT3634229.1 dihydropyrimidinase [Candidatus Neomarinimicrobiota bacterium]MBT3682972.1 dihydropyrimidinase [Candidatus Neomarinimicrobiota bacterium]MBT3760038.1 dihydropyrimidinase [Candidatus Neomarinimicrobiota bacterium]MBT3896195.1 dihydropyrimidinase [Candidatus Neomarinimicrobiota bacterium]
MSLLIKNGRIITAVDDYHADIFIENETVALIGKELKIDADNVVDAKGKYVFPGGIDPHTHLDMPFGGTVSSDDFETGTRAAAYGGTTTLIDFAIQTQGQSPLEGLDIWQAKADGKTAIDYGFHMIITDMPDRYLTDLKVLIDRGVTSYKLFTAYPGVLYMSDGMIFNTMRKAGEMGAMISVHAENGIVIDEIVKLAIAEGKTSPKWHALTRPTRMEAEAVHRTIAIAELAESPLYIVHLTSADALDEVTMARDQGLPVFAETCPQYLLLDLDHYGDEGFDGAKYVMSPPLREKWNQEHLWRGIQTGDLQTIATDHCPFRMEDQKILGKDVFTKIPNGAPGIENRMSLIYNSGVVEGRISLNKFVEITSTAAAKTFGLFPKKGTIAVGSDADIVIFDPERKETISVTNSCTHHMNVDYNAYEGFDIQGLSETVISRGKIIVDDCKYVGNKGNGQFLKRSLFSE